MTEIKVGIYGCNEKDTTKLGVTIGYSLTTIDLPNGETFISCASGSTILGKSANSLSSENQME